MKKALMILVFACICYFVSVGNALAQSVPNEAYGKKLPYTWETPFMGGKMISTMTEEGVIYSQLITPCVICNQSGRCQVCFGTGGQYWAGLGMQACMRCLGSGGCMSCHGKGIQVMNTTTSRYGGTIGYDENGNMYIGTGNVGSGGRHRSSVYNCCSGVPTFGYTRYHRCANCGETHIVGGHKCVRE